MRTDASEHNDPTYTYHPTYHDKQQTSCLQGKSGSTVVLMRTLLYMVHF